MLFWVAELNNVVLSIWIGRHPFIDLQRRSSRLGGLSSVSNVPNCCPFISMILTRKVYDSQWNFLSFWKPLFASLYSPICMGEACPRLVLGTKCWGYIPFSLLQTSFVRHTFSVSQASIGLKCHLCLNSLSAQAPVLVLMLFDLRGFHWWAMSVFQCNFFIRIHPPSTSLSFKNQLSSFFLLFFCY